MEWDPIWSVFPVELWWSILLACTRLSQCLGFLVFNAALFSQQWFRNSSSKSVSEGYQKQILFHEQTFTFLDMYQFSQALTCQTMSLFPQNLICLPMFLFLQNLTYLSMYLFSKTLTYFSMYLFSKTLTYLTMYLLPQTISFLTMFMYMFPLNLTSEACLCPFQLNSLCLWKLGADVMFGPLNPVDTSNLLTMELSGSHQQHRFLTL